jgi:hypothetical protein
LGGSPLEFVLGLGDVIEGIEIALKQMHKGTKASIGMSSDMAYGTEGLPTKVPPDCPLQCEMELLSFRKRNVWFKPCVQAPGFTQQPYHEDDYRSNLLDAVSA